MADLLDDHIDSTIDEIEAEALTAYCTRIPSDDDAGSAPPAFPDEPEDVLAALIAQHVVSMRTALPAERPAA